MLKIARKHPMLCACAVVAAVSLATALFGLAFPRVVVGLTLFALLPFLAAVVVALVILNYKVFGGQTTPSIHHPGADPGDTRR